MNINAHREAQFPHAFVWGVDLLVGALSLGMIHAPPSLGIGRTTGRRFPPLRPDFVIRNLFPFRQVAISGRKPSQPGGGVGAFVMLSICEQSKPASRIICASSLSRGTGVDPPWAFATVGKHARATASATKCSLDISLSKGQRLSNFSSHHSCGVPGGRSIPDLEQRRQCIPNSPQ
jgi:hypothetical protein